MATHRLMPPANGPFNATVNGRTYSCASGATIDVPDFDANVLMANGWMAAAVGGAGVTSTRPVLNINQRGTSYHDTTLGKNIVWDGKVWRDPTSGAAV